MENPIITYFISQKSMENHSPQPNPSPEIRLKCIGISHPYANICLGGQEVLWNTTLFYV
jgi:hypothetical protein